MKGVFHISTTTPVLDFKPISIADQSEMRALLANGSRGALEYCFTSNFIWREIYHLRAAIAFDRLIVMSNPKNPSFIFPTGKGDVTPLIKALSDYTRQLGKPLVFNTVLNEDKDRLEAAFPGQFEFIPDRNDYDYIYEAQRMISLSGKKLSGKRNHINRFMAQTRNWAYEAITHENIDQAHEMSLEWCRMAGCRDSEELFDESCAVEQAFKHFFELGLTGGLLRREGKVIAFSMGEALNENTYVIHIEKAFHDIQGAYQLINQEFAKANCAGFQYINREDDAGDPGLRKAKLSYDPAFLVEKSEARLLHHL